jgi:hypothetical protein
MWPYRPGRKPSLILGLSGQYLQQQWQGRSKGSGQRVQHALRRYGRHAGMYGECCYATASLLSTYGTTPSTAKQLEAPPYLCWVEYEGSAMQACNRHASFTTPSYTTQHNYGCGVLQTGDPDVLFPVRCCSSHQFTCLEACLRSPRKPSSRQTVPNGNLLLQLLAHAPACQPTLHHDVLVGALRCCKGCWWEPDVDCAVLLEAQQEFHS